MHTFVFTSARARRFAVRVLEKGEPIGDGRKLHPNADPLVEFWDLTDVAGLLVGDFTKAPKAQKVTDFYVKTLRARHTPGLGLALDLSDPLWHIDGPSMDRVHAFFDQVVPRDGAGTP